MDKLLKEKINQNKEVEMEKNASCGKARTSKTVNPTGKYSGELTHSPSKQKTVKDSPRYEQK